MKFEWLLAARNLKRVLALTFHRETYTLQLCGRTFRIGYEDRKSHEDRDYLLLQELAQNQHCR